MKRLLNLCPLLALSLAACAPEGGPAGTPIDMEREAEVVKVLEDQWSEMYGAKDLDGIVALLARDTVLLAPGGTAVIGVENVRRATGQAMETETTEGMSVSWRSESAVIAPSGEMAYDYGTATVVLADGSEITSPYLVVWIRENGEWKIAADIYK